MEKERKFGWSEECGTAFQLLKKMLSSNPVCYFSKKFNRRQLNYSTVEQEALGLVQALKHFDVYLKTPYHVVTVFTDNNPLVFVNRAKHCNQKILRWSLLFQEYQMKIEHIPGSENILADALSRI